MEGDKRPQKRQGEAGETILWVTVLAANPQNLTAIPRTLKFISPHTHHGAPQHPINMRVHAHTHAHNLITL